MGVRRGGRPIQASDEAIDYAFEKRVVHQWSYTKIAEGLLNEHQVESDVRPGDPVSITTVRNYIALGAKKMNKENYYRRNVQRAVHIRQLDDLTEWLYELRQGLSEDDTPPRERYAFVDTILKLQKRAADLLDLDMQLERTEIRHTGKGPKLTMDTTDNFDLAAFEEDIRKKREQRQVPS